MADELSKEQAIEQAFDDLERSFSELAQALGRDFALGSIFIISRALAMVRRERLNYARYRELELPLTD